ncbi:MAG: hypothetical protein WCP34_13415, partial [Pseudomonadota bacterium]
MTPSLPSREATTPEELRNMETLYLGRQAILDRQQRLYAYELLYRTEPGGVATITDGDSASSQVILNAFVELGLDHIVGPHLAFINLTRSFFVDLPPIPFEKNRVVLEVLENIEIDAALINGVKLLAEQGYTLALDDF